MKTEIPPPFKSVKPKQTRGRGKPIGKRPMIRQNPVKEQEPEETFADDNSNNYYHNDNYTSPNHLFAGLKNVQ